MRLWAYDVGGGGFAKHVPCNRMSTSLHKCETPL